MRIHYFRPSQPGPRSTILGLAPVYLPFSKTTTPFHHHVAHSLRREVAESRRQPIVTRLGIARMDERADHWDLFVGMLEQSVAIGNLVAGAWHAALAIEHGCEWITDDTDFSRFRDFAGADRADVHRA